MKVALATLLLPYAAARVGLKTRKLTTPMDPHKGHLTPVATLEDTTEHRIIGGEVAESGDFPYYVNWPDEEDGGFCGGSLIHEDIILTAAHCNSIVGDSVIIGAYFLQSVDSNAEPGFIETRMVHPNYNDETIENDVMVLKITAPSLLPPIALNDDSASPSVGEDVVAIGLGIADDGDVADTLRKVTVPIVAHDQCAADYAGAIVEDVMLCAGLEEGGKDSCQGDSGGPLLELRDGEYVQVGITSWGNGCAEPNSPGVYTRVSGVRSWIDQMICELSNNPPASCGSTSLPTPSAPTPSEPTPSAPTPSEPTPSAPTPSEPTPTEPTCEDSTVEEFFVNEEIGNRDCAWLNSNQEQYGYLCRFVDVAFVCPVTCDICDRINQLGIV